MEAPEEDYIDASEFLGKKTKFQNFDAKEIEKEKQEELAIQSRIVSGVMTGQADILEAVESSAEVKLQKLSGFAMTEDNRIIVSSMKWQDYNESEVLSTTLLKQVPVGDINEDLRFPYTNEYIC